jgi:hypothetical protein
MKRLVLLALACTALMAADLNGRWSTGGTNVFVLRHVGNTLTGTIEGAPGEPVYKIVDGRVNGDQVHFFVLHEDPADPEVKANGGKPFHNFAAGTVEGDEMVLSGSRENTTIREFRMVLKRVKN